MCGKPGKGRHGTNKIISSSRSWDICYESVNGWTDGRTNGQGDCNIAPFLRVGVSQAYNSKKWFYLYRVSPFQVYRTSTSCLQCDFEFFMFAVMKTFVTVILASTGRNDFIFDIWLWHDDLYCVSPFQVYRTSSSCLPTYKWTSGGILSTT
jgi:hypothetical protein